MLCFSLRYILAFIEFQYNRIRRLPFFQPSILFLAAYRSSPLGIHKQTNACWSLYSLPRCQHEKNVSLTAVCSGWRRLHMRGTTGIWPANLSEEKLKKIEMHKQTRRKIHDIGGISIQQTRDFPSSLTQTMPNRAKQD